MPIDNLVDAIIAISRVHPDRVAVEYQSSKQSYGELLDRAVDVSRTFSSMGLEHGDRVVLLVDREPEWYPVILGCWMTGLVVVPCESNAPDEQISLLCDEVEPKLVVSRREPDRHEKSGRKQISFGKLLAEGVVADETGPILFKSKCNAASPAYIMFTSGSTGRPKGVVVSHDSLYAFARAILSVNQTSESSRVAQSARLTFDASLQQMVSAWLVGATLLPVPDAVRRTGDAYADWLRSERVTHWDSVPSLWRPVLSALERTGEPLADLDCLILAGEAPSATDMNAWRELHPVSRLYNVYGPTEATVDVCAFEVMKPLAPGPVPVGKPLQGAEIWVVDEGGRECPTGQEGFVHLSGIFIAEGYFRSPAATRASFPTLDLGGRARRTFATGDLGCVTESGDLVVLGRTDSQIKVNGVRINLEALRQKIRSSRIVVDACVVSYRASEDGTNLIGAAVVIAGGYSKRELRAELVSRLRPSEVPARVVLVPEIPLTKTGKRDERAVRALISEARQS